MVADPAVTTHHALDAGLLVKTQVVHSLSRHTAPLQLHRAVTATGQRNFPFDNRSVECLFGYVQPGCDIPAVNSVWFQLSAIVQIIGPSLQISLLWSVP